MRDAGEAASLQRAGGSISAVTARGGLRIEAHDKMRPVASESLTTQSWSHRVALCLPEDACAMDQRTVLTEIGRDADALRAEDRSAALFDLGLGTLQVNACIRTGDTDVIAALKNWTGRSLFEPGNGAMGLILAANPHRVFVSRMGRVEVYQPIPAADGKSPEGPHTHVLPRLLRHKRTHAATEFVPAGFVPCAHLYPPHPARDAMGHSPAVSARSPRVFPGPARTSRRSGTRGHQTPGTGRRQGGTPAVRAVAAGRQVQPRRTADRAPPDQNVRRAGAGDRCLARGLRSRRSRRARSKSIPARPDRRGEKDLSSCG